MTIDQARDRIARLLGWTRTCDRVRPHPIHAYEWWTRRDDKHSGQDAHPIPADTDGLLDLIEKAGYGWERHLCGTNEWVAQKLGRTWIDGVRVPVTDNRIEDLTRLLLAVLEAQQPNPRGDAT